MKYYTVENKNKSIYKTFAIYFICMAVFCVIRIVASLKVFSTAGSWIDIIFTILIQIGALFLLPLLLYCIFLKVKPKQVFKTCNFGKVSVITVVISIGIGLICFVINIAVSSLFNGLLSFTGYDFGSSGGYADYSTGNFFLQLLLVAIIPAFCEEFIHRGIVLQGTKQFGFKKAIVLSALLFGLIHFNIRQVSYAFVLGLIMAFVDVVAKSIWPSIIIHFVNNAISTYIDFASARHWFLGDLLEKLQNALTSGHSFWIFVVCVIVMLAVVALLCLLIWLLYKDSIIRKVNRAIDKAYSMDSRYFRNQPIVVGEQEMIKDLLENNTLLNLDIKKTENPIDIVLPKEKSRYKPRPMDYLFLYSSIILGGLVTIFTYVWGLL